jgi:hypothetical protein
MRTLTETTYGVGRPAPVLSTAMAALAGRNREHQTSAVVKERFGGRLPSVRAERRAAGAAEKQVRLQKQILVVAMFPRRSQIG